MDLEVCMFYLHLIKSGQGQDVDLVKYAQEKLNALVQKNIITRVNIYPTPGEQVGVIINYDKGTASLEDETTINQVIQALLVGPDNQVKVIKGSTATTLERLYCETVIQPQIKTCSLSSYGINPFFARDIAADQALRSRLCKDVNLRVQKETDVGVVISNKLLGDDFDSSVITKSAACIAEKVPDASYRTVISFDPGSAEVSTNNPYHLFAKKVDGDPKLQKKLVKEGLREVTMSIERDKVNVCVTKNTLF